MQCVVFIQFSLQCFNAIGWTTGGASSLRVMVCAARRHSGSS